MKKHLLLLIMAAFSLNISAQNIPDVTLTDSHGETHNLHEILASGQAVLFDFFASWCGPCELITPRVNQFYLANGSNSTGKISVFGVSIEPTDDADKVNSLGWGADYPKIPYSTEGMEIYNFYRNLGSGGIPFFVTICPNPDAPAESEVLWVDTGADPNLFIFTLPSQLNGNCPTAVVSTNELSGFDQFKVFPNPASEDLNVQFDFDRTLEADIKIIDMLGQTLMNNQSTLFQGANNLNYKVGDFSSGLYNLVIETEEGQKSMRFIVE